jgi:hypothetical protein
MQTNPIMGLVMCFALSFALIAGSGVGDMIFEEQTQPNPGDGLQTYEEVSKDKQTITAGIIDAISGNPLIGFIIDFANTAKTLFGTVALLPVYLTRLGFPAYFAFPVGTLCQVITTVGFYQVLTGHELL